MMMTYSISHLSLDGVADDGEKGRYGSGRDDAVQENGHQQDTGHCSIHLHHLLLLRNLSVRLLAICNSVTVRSCCSCVTFMLFVGCCLLFVCCFTGVAFLPSCCLLIVRLLLLFRSILMNAASTACKAFPHARPVPSMKGIANNASTQLSSYPFSLLSFLSYSSFLSLFLLFISSFPFHSFLLTTLHFPSYSSLFSSISSFYTLCSSETSNLIVRKCSVRYFLTDVCYQTKVPPWRKVLDKLRSI